MMVRFVVAILAGALCLCLQNVPTAAQQPMITEEAWHAYKARFLDPSGRIIDDGNGNISHSEGQGANGAIETVDVNSGSIANTLSDPGYRILNHVLACVIDKTALPTDLTQFAPTLYYPSTLHLLGLSFVTATQPECI